MRKVNPTFVSIRECILVRHKTILMSQKSQTINMHIESFCEQNF